MPSSQKFCERCGGGLIFRIKNNISTDTSTNETRLKVRELTMLKVGTFIPISGQVVHTHLFRPELVSGTLTCLDCQTAIKNVQQQFKLLFGLRLLKIKNAQAGDRCDFVGTLIVVPHIDVLNLPGTETETSRYRATDGPEDCEGLQGLKALDVQQLHYRLAFLLYNVAAINTHTGEWHLQDTSPESLRRQMTPSEWEKLFEMSNDKNLYHNLVNRLFPTIHGNEEMKRGILLKLFGDVPKTTQEGTTLRGTINICIVGDPCIANSRNFSNRLQIFVRELYTHPLKHPVLLV